MNIIKNNLRNCINSFLNPKSPARLYVEKKPHLYAWAKQYFNPASGRLDVLIPKWELYDECIKMNLTRITMHEFWKFLKAFCEVTPYIEEINPKYAQNYRDRIVLKDDNGKIKEYIFIKSKMYDHE